MCDAFTDLRWVHDDCGDKIEEDVVTVGPYSGVVESHLQLIHGFKQQTLSFIVKVFKRGLLVKTQEKKVKSYIIYNNHMFFSFIYLFIILVIPKTSEFNLKRECKDSFFQLLSYLCDQI